jgi:hypothetical protein
VLVWSGSFSQSRLILTTSSNCNVIEQQLQFYFKGANRWMFSP